MAYTKEDCIQSLQRAAQTLGHSPSAREYDAVKCGPCRSSLKKYFHNFNEAKEAASLMIRTYQYTDKELLNNLRLIATDLGRAPSRAEYSIHPLRICNIATICIHFGSMHNACRKAGIKQTVRALGHAKTNRTKITQEILLLDLYNALICHPDKSFQACIGYTSHAKKTYKKYFGSIDALQLLIQNKYSLSIKAKKNIVWTKRIIEEEFKRIESLLNKRPTLKEIKEHSIYRNIGYGIRKTFRTYSILAMNMGYCIRESKMTEEKLNQKKQYWAKKLRLAYKSKGNAWNNYPVVKWCKICNISKSSIVVYFGTIENWFKEAHVPVPRTLQYKNDQLLLEETLKALKTLARKLKRAPSIREYDSSEKRSYSSRTIINHFDSWNKALEAAGLR